MLEIAIIKLTRNERKHLFQEIVSSQGRLTCTVRKLPCFTHAQFIEYLETIEKKAQELQ